MTITATELKTNLGAYLDAVASGASEVIITKNGRAIARLSNPNLGRLAALQKLSSLVPDNRSAALTDEEVRNSRLEEKYGEYFV